MKDHTTETLSLEPSEVAFYVIRYKTVEHIEQKFGHYSKSYQLLIIYIIYLISHQQKCKRGFFCTHNFNPNDPFIADVWPEARLGSSLCRHGDTWTGTRQQSATSQVVCAVQGLGAHGVHGNSGNNSGNNNARR